MSISASVKIIAFIPARNIRRVLAVCSLIAARFALSLLSAPIWFGSISRICSVDWFAKFGSVKILNVPNRSYGKIHYTDVKGDDFVCLVVELGGLGKMFVMMNCAFFLPLICAKFGSSFISILVIIPMFRLTIFV